MIIFKDIFTDAELFSDSYDFTEVGDGIALEANCSMIEVGGENFDTGANASAEEAEEDLEEGKEKVNNIVHSFRLQEITPKYSKKDYKSHLGKYMKAIKAKLTEQGKPAEEIADFEKKAAAFAGKILKNFDDYDHYTGDSFDDPKMVILLNYREDGTTPYFTFWKHGLTEMKV
ncbi:Mss4-like protein [Pseudomassariella vexata]|uniref:Translationally-controlled tumor protein homolog n=1 Tax=Pseudomassariella vexata TaxID=1141098 RepID=A0A1Y2DIS5_9PEZI|nr:Mss4-like protein [Pseudomassariella vexata]ORY59148.1 Mss4-like protein [Pseudomassariella vexata]